MSPFSRRSFLGSAGGLAAALAAGPPLLAQDAAPPKVTSDAGSAEKPAADPFPFSPETLFLTYQCDPTTAITVQWVGSAWEVADPTIWFAPAAPLPVVPAFAEGWAPAAPTAVKPFPMTDLKVFRAEITGLRPGTEYKFKIGRRGVEYKFRTLPAKLTDSLHFITGGDCGVNPHAVANNILAAKQDPWFVVIGGDLGYDNGKSPLTALAFLKNYSKHMVDSRGRLIPMVAILGNHEVDGGYGRPRAKAPFFLALFDGLFPETTYATLDIGDYLSFVLLDTGHVSPIGGEQTLWLDGVLRDRRDRPHLVVVNHCPAYPSYRPAAVGADGKSGTGEGNRTHWVPLFDKYAVDVVLEHHDHTFKRTHPLTGGHKDANGVLYLGDGSWGKLRAPKAPEKRGYLATASPSYHMTLHRVEPDQAFHLALEETGKVLDVCRTAKKPRRR